MKKSKIVQTIVPVITVIFAILILISTGDAALDLTQYKWKNRLLFVFAPHSRHPLYVDLKNNIAAQKEEVLDRDLIVFEIFENDTSLKDMTEIDPESAVAVRQNFEVPSGLFTVILVGKDGGVKLRRNEQVNLRDIFLLIDAMPMRREEMRQKNQ